MALSKELKHLISSEPLNNKSFKEIVKESNYLNKSVNKEIKKISSKQILKQRIAQLYVLGNYSVKDIASIFNIHSHTVRRLLKDNEVLDIINNYQQEEKEIVDSRLKALRYKATETLYELLDSDDDSIRLQASKDVLDRTGHKADNKNTLDINISYEQQLNNLIEGIDYTEIIVDD